MANEEQLAILRQGVDAWNKWRKNLWMMKNPPKEIDLNEADLRNAYLEEANLSGANLRGANLSGLSYNVTNILNPAQRQDELSGADLSNTNLSRAALVGVNLVGTNLREANLYRASLAGANLREADLSEASLREAFLHSTNLMGARLVKTNFKGARVGAAVFGNTDLSEVIGLEDIIHLGPSSISTDSFVLSKGRIPETFLRGCGLSDWEIESAKLYNPDLSKDKKDSILYKMHELLAGQVLQISPLFISYSHGDTTFVDKLEEHLSKKGIRFWRDTHDATAGRLEKQIDRAIRLNPTVLLILSENSLQSDWVEHEVRTARALEKEMKRDVLCPVALDNSWKHSPWAKRIMEQVLEYNILDFSGWKDDSEFLNVFSKLIDGLDLFYN